YRATQTETHHHWHWRGNAGQARRLSQTSTDLSPWNLLHRRRAWFCHRRPNRHSDVGRSIFCRLDIPPRHATAHVAATILERSPTATYDDKIRTRGTCVRNQLTDREVRSLPS